MIDISLPQLCQMSFPLAFMFYRYVFGIMPFYILSFLAIYVILAIGADDVFVCECHSYDHNDHILLLRWGSDDTRARIVLCFLWALARSVMDAWRQSAFEGPAVTANLHTRMAYTFKRAAKAMLITSVCCQRRGCTLAGPIGLPPPVFN